MSGPAGPAGASGATGAQANPGREGDQGGARAAEGLTGQRRPGRRRWRSTARTASTRPSRSRSSGLRRLESRTAHGSRLVGGELASPAASGSTRRRHRHDQDVSCGRRRGCRRRPAALEPVGPVVSLHVNKRPNDVSAPTIHVAVVGAAVPAQHVGLHGTVYSRTTTRRPDVGKPYTLDAYTGQWWSALGHAEPPASDEGADASFMADEPQRSSPDQLDNGGDRTPSRSTTSPPARTTS